MRKVKNKKRRGVRRKVQKQDRRQEVRCVFLEKTRGIQKVGAQHLSIKTRQEERGEQKILKTRQEEMVRTKV